MTSGIYKIQNLSNGKFYIGSSVNIRNRISHHINQLVNKTHHNQVLQCAWEKYGPENFEGVLVEEVQDKALLLDREQYYIDLLEPEYNICRVAGNSLGRQHTIETRRKISQSHADVSGENNPMFGKRGKLSPNFGKSRKQETLIKMRLNHRNVSGENNPNYGKKHSEDVRKKISESQKGELSNKAKLTWEEVREIRRLYKDEHMTPKNIALCYNVSYTTIRLIVNNKTWKE
jgi:group I intron endonuclease